MVERVHVKRTRGRTNEMCLEMVHVRRIKERTNVCGGENVRRMRGRENGEEGRTNSCSRKSTCTYK